ncbi:DUF3310 domain-containing protein [Anaerotignum sp. MB30-C6]|uniref:DUF3310 domain-containing protein n=1 Tax=Anaerotignum sp. MB30-C6 TaxID=3070814 RepID=UPI0027DB22C5|nr:DUF3310 domain-containing protein [Anaerotignum sp. MB30-C6]WMI81583.1 DUF3310 domain-containing protein [Anaerotignum sp. MB30-C6]
MKPLRMSKNTIHSPRGESIIDTVYTPLSDYIPPVPPPRVDTVNHPSHYTHGEIECIDAINAAVHDLKGLEAVCTANVIKYLWRWKHKNGVEGLKKARWYLDKLIKEVVDGEKR